MSQAETGEEAVGVQEHHLLPYGVGGDYIGARRARRSFRLLVLACLGITVSLYFSEHYLRYGLSEVQYRMAMTHETESKRPILRNVVARDARESEVPTAKYVAALAYIEEDDLVLERFAEAVALAPDDEALLTVYGCKLFQLRQYNDARNVFREASLKSVRNALPDYLHAAAVAASSSSEEDFRTAVAMVARTNDGGAPTVYPQPYWHDSLPRQGYWYAGLRRDLADLVCAPLYDLKNIIVRRVRAEMEAGNTQGLETWLYQLQILGQHLVGNDQDGAGTRSTSVLIAGLKLQQDAVALRYELATPEKRAELSAAQSRLKEAMERVVRFETERSATLPARRAHARFPVYVALLGTLILGASSALVVVLNRLAKSDRHARAVRHPGGILAIVAVWLGLVALFLLLAVSGFAGLIGAGNGLLLWVGLTASIVIVALVYPAYTLPSETQVCSRFLSEPGYNDRLLEARTMRRRAYLSLAGRCLNIALGLYVCLLCAGTIGFRTTTGLYPTDIKLFVSGVLAEEQALIQSIQLSL